MSATFSSTNIDVTTSSTAATALSLTLARKRYAFDQHERIKKRRKQLNPVRLPLLDYSFDSHPDVETSDTENDKHINYSQQLQTLSTPPSLKVDEIISNIKVEPQSDSSTIAIAANITTEETFASLKIEPEQHLTSLKIEPTSPSPSNIDTLSGSNALPLNLTKNARVLDCPIKVEPKVETVAPPQPRQLYSPRKEEFPLKSNSSSSSSLPAESPNSYEHFIASGLSEDRKDRSPPFSPKTPPVTVMRNIFTNSVTRTTCRIFNPEAFCNICNKEFCNKYFLKTHKANKHGVYCETKDSTIESDMPAVPLMFTWNVKNNNVKLPSNPYLFNNNSTIATAAISTVKDSSAFCNICEKEFCNKYFLRRHKEKMHGIVQSDGRKSETELEKSELDDADRILPISSAGNTDESKSCHNYKHNELTRNTKVKLKHQHKVYAASTTDTVSDFIKICLTNKCLPKSEVAEHIAAESESDYDFIKREEGVDFNNISKMMAERSMLHRYEDGQQGNIAADYSLQQSFIKDEDSQESFQKQQPLLHTVDDPNNRLSPPRYTCEQCKKFLSTQAILRLHQKYVHALALEEPTTDKEDFEFKLMESAYFMILKFSWLNTAVTFCEICKTEFDKNEVLEMHLMNKHGTLVDELSRIIEDASANGLSAPALSTSDGHIICQICNKTFTTNAAFQQHVYEKCTYPEYKEYSGEVAGSVALGEDNIANDSSKSTRNFCEICKKELCNKYFMKTHMRRMHGIAIQNGVRIGGVTCEICNKELCSKYFLRVHKKNCHGIMENMQQFAKLLLQDCDKLEDMVHQQQRQASQVCTLCGRIFKSIKWLKTHLLADHGKLGANVWHDITGLGVDVTGEVIPDVGGGNGERCSSNDDEKYISSAPALVYQCSRCQFQASSVDLLLTHQRLHMKPSDHLQYRCLYCFVVTKDKVALEEHIAYHHFGNAELTEKNEFLMRHHVTGKGKLLYSYF